MKNRIIDRLCVSGSRALATALTLLCACLVMTSCGGGAAGGAGGASIPDSEYSTHNAGGWGGGGSSGGSGGSGSGGNGVNMTGGTPLVVDHYEYGGTSYAGSQINELIAAVQNNAGVQNTTFYIPFYVSGDSAVRQARVTKGNVRVEKFEHQYKATCIDSSTSTTTTKYFYKDDGLNLSDITTQLMTGWLCLENGTTYSGSIGGIGCDITLSAQFPTFPATADTYILKASNTSGDSDCSTTIHVEGVTGTPTATVSDNALLTIESFALVPSSDPPRYDATVHITGYYSAAYFTDNTIATVTITDPNTSQEATVTFTLKNKYNVAINYDGSTYRITSPFEQGAELTFNSANNVVQSAIPAGREVVAFKYGSDIKLYKTAGAGRPTSIAVTSANFTGLTSRTIWLVPVLDFTWSYTSGGDTSVTGQDGTAANPFIVKYQGTALQTQLNLAINDSIGNVDIEVTNGPGDWFTIGGTSSNPTLELYSSAVVADNIPAGGMPFTFTLTDPSTGATKNLYLKVTKPPVLPEFYVDMTAPTNATVSSPNVYSLADLTTPFTFTPTPTTDGNYFPEGTTFSWSLATINSNGDEIYQITPTTQLSTNNGVLTITPNELGLSANVISNLSSSPDQISVSCTAHNTDAATQNLNAAFAISPQVFKLLSQPDFTVGITQSTSGVNSTSTVNTPVAGTPVYAMTSLTTTNKFTFTATPDSGSFVTGSTFCWSIQADGLTPLQLTSDTLDDTTLEIPLTDLGLTLNNIGTSTNTAKLITITCTIRNNNSAGDKVVTKYMKVYKYTLPDGTATVSTTTAEESPSGKYRVNATNNTFTFSLSAASNLPAANVADYNWYASVDNGVTFTDLHCYALTCSKTLSAMGISSLNSISHDSGSPTEIIIKCHVEYSGLEKDYTTTIKLWTRPAMSLLSNYSEISKPSTLLASLNITQDSEGTAVKPATAQLTVGGSTNYTFTTSPSGKINVSGTGAVSIADGYTPPPTGETVTITATDNADSTYHESTTITISSQYVCALYVDKATCDANGTPGWTKILSGSSSVPVSPYTAYGANFESSRPGRTISAWKKVGGSGIIENNQSASVSVQDTKIYAGWAPQVSPSSITLYRFSGNDANLSASLTLPDNVSWTVTPGNGFTFGSGSVTVLESANFNTSNGIYTDAKIHAYINGQQESFIDIPITVKDCIYVDDTGRLRKQSGTGMPTITIPENYTIPTTVGGRTVTKIPEYLFYGNNTIKTLSIPDGMTIEQCAFEECTELTTLTIGNNVRFINASHFYKCSKLETINVGTGVDFDDDGFCYWVFAETAVKDFTFPSDSSVVPRNIFYGCTQLRQITIPSGVTTIRSSAFEDATFQTLVIPTSVNQIDGSAFRGATGTIDYAGTIDQWKAVSRGTAGGNSNNVTVHCTDGNVPYWEGL